MMKNQFEMRRLMKRIQEEWFAPRGGDTHDNRVRLVETGKQHSDNGGDPFPYRDEQAALRHLKLPLDYDKGWIREFIDYWNHVLDRVSQVGDHPSESRETLEDRTFRTEDIALATQLRLHGFQLQMDPVGERRVAWVFGLDSPEDTERLAHLVDEYRGDSSQVRAFMREYRQVHRELRAFLDGEDRPARRAV